MPTSAKHRHQAEHQRRRPSASECAPKHLLCCYLGGQATLAPAQHCYQAEHQQRPPSVSECAPKHPPCDDGTTTIACAGRWHWQRPQDPAACAPLLPRPPQVWAPTQHFRATARPFPRPHAWHAHCSRSQAMAAASQAVHPPSGCTEATMVPARTPTCSQGATACQTLTAPVGSRAPPCPAQPPPRRCRRRTATAAHSRLTHTSARCCCYSSAGPAAATRTCACCCCCTSANPTAATASVTATAGARCFPGVTATGLAATALSCASAHAAAARGCPHPCARRCRHQPPARAQTHQLRPAACLAVAPPGQGVQCARCPCMSADLRSPACSRTRRWSRRGGATTAGC
mmetsp:Transcript_11077/g.32943  ORF Transcript_11077/g.32943 Transcript_11077/m.32943 type:complete len:345 (+) Transcript_11077:428-1462(+)